MVSTTSEARNNWYSASALMILLLFIAGFLAGEDGMGGGIRCDLYDFHGPTISALRHQPWKLVLQDYSSATMPLFHILESFNPTFGIDTAFRASNLLLALVTVACFGAALLRRFPANHNFRWPFVMIPASLLLSVYFRAETYWVTTDILPILFLIVTAFLLMPVQESWQLSDRQTMGKIIALAVLSWATFYCRQTYLFAPVYVFVVLFITYKKERWLTMLSFGLLTLPAIYLIWLWKGINPPRFQHHKRLSIDGIVAPLSMILTYAIPFMIEALIENRHNLRPLLQRAKRSLPWVIGGWLLFLGAFRSYRFDPQNRGGGVASKTLSHLGTPGAFLFLTTGFLGLLLVIWLLRESDWRGRLLLICFLLPAMAMALFYQRYYDPFLVIFFFLFVRKSVVRRFLRVRTAVLLMGFNLVLAVGAMAINGASKPVIWPLSAGAPHCNVPLDAHVVGIN